MTESDVISARPTVLETVLRQLITHMAVRDDDPLRWVRTRKAVAMKAMRADCPRDATLPQEATAEFFDPAERVAGDYTYAGKPGTPRPLIR